MDEIAHAAEGIAALPNLSNGCSTSAESIGIREPGDPRDILALLDEWRSDESGYDEAVWPALKAALETNRAGARRIFRE